MFKTQIIYSLFITTITPIGCDSDFNLLLANELLPLLDSNLIIKQKNKTRNFIIQRNICKDCLIFLSQSAIFVKKHQMSLHMGLKMLKKSPLEQDVESKIILKKLISAHKVLAEHCKVKEGNKNDRNLVNHNNTSINFPGNVFSKEY